jgi:hypothetical protein
MAEEHQAQRERVVDLFGVQQDLVLRDNSLRNADQIILLATFRRDLFSHSTSGILTDCEEYYLDPGQQKEKEHGNVKMLHLLVIQLERVQEEDNQIQCI